MNHVEIPCRKTREHPPVAIDDEQMAIAAGHESYADIVNLVTPGVVTVRTQGKETVKPSA